MLGVIKALTDVCNYVKELKQYFALKDKVLWTGSLSGGQTITINNLSKYQLVEMFTTYGTFFTNPQSGFVRGIHSDLEGGTTGVNDIALVYGQITGDSFNLIQCYYTPHYLNSQHGGAYAIKITKIIGHEPIVPQTLTKLGGGIDTVRGWLCAVSEKMSTGYRKLCKYVNQLFTNWNNFDTMGKLGTNSCGNRQGKSYSQISKTIFKHTSSISRISGWNKFSRTILMQCKNYQHNTIYDGVSQSIQCFSKFTGQLDSNRQSVTSDWGCYCA